MIRIGYEGAFSRSFLGLTLRSCKLIGVLPTTSITFVNLSAPYIVTRGMSE